MKQAFQDLVDFHEKFNMDYHHGPRMLPPAQMLHRLKFLNEELGEYCSASTIVKQVDALIDLIYVALGTLYLAGIDAPEAWRRVHESNMAKVPLPSNQTTGKRDATFDGVMKPPGWKPPDLEELCRPQGWINQTRDGRPVR